MTAQAIDKIFVDPDDEIIFVVEKILKTPSAKVVMVIPAGSSIESSAISMKLLSRQIVDSSKNIVLVSDNPVAKSLARKAHLVVRDKVSMVDKSSWDEAAKLKAELLDHKNNLKHDLLSARKPEEIEAEQIEEPEVEKAPEPKVEKTVNLPDEEELFGEKPRLEGKQMEIAGIAILAGGDIKAAKASDLVSASPVVANTAPKEEMIEESEEIVEKSEDAEENEAEAEQVEKSDIDERRKKQTAKSSKFDKRKTGKIIGIVAVAILLLIGGFYAFSFFVLANVKIDVNFNQSEGEFNKTVTVSTKATSVDSDNSVIPGSEITLEESSSGDAEATGAKETGEFGQGLIDIYNKDKESAVNLAKGQIVTDISSNKQYTITSNVVIPKDFTKRDVPIKAKEFGKDYNIEGEVTSYTIQGFTTDQMIAYGFRGVSGGTTEEITVVTAEDAAKLKAELEKSVKANLTNNLKNQVGQGEVLLEGSEKFEEVSYKQSVKTDEEAENFSAELKMKVTATKVSESDIEALSAEIIKDSEKASDGAEITVADFTIKNVKVDGSNVAFQLSATGEVNENLDLEEQKSIISGKSIPEAETYLESLDQIDEVTITYSPSYIPESMRKIPSNPSKIEFE